MFRIISLLLLLPSIVFSQNDYGSIAGTVKLADGAPAAYTSIALKGTRITVFANTSGSFEISKVRPGTYTLIASYSGTQSLEQLVQVEAGEKRQLPAITLEASSQLQSVEVTGRKENSYKNSRSFSATKIEMAIKDVPQAISTVTKELMQDQQAFRTGDVLKNVSGVNQFSGYDDYTLRGFRSNTQLLNGLKTVVGFWSQPLLVNIERVEVIKGPAAALFGNTDPGGTINRVTKKPLDTKRSTFSFSAGSFQTYRATADLTGPLDEERRLLYRLNVGYENTETFKTNQAAENFLVSPSLSFAPSEKTRVNLDVVFAYSNSKLYRGQPIFGATAGTQLNSTPTSFTVGRANDYLKEKSFSSNISLSHEFNKNLSFNLSYLKFQWVENLMEHRTSNSYAVDSAGQQIPTLMQMQTIRRMSRNYNDNLTAYFVSRFVTGRFSHQLLVGYDYNQYSVPVGGSQQVARGYRLKAGGVANTYKPERIDDYVLDAAGNPVPNVPHFDLVTPDYSIANVSDYFTTSTATNPARDQAHGIYVQDQIRLNRVSLLVGLRQEFYRDKFNFRKPNEQSISQTAFIPRIGMVYNLTRNINLYGLYVQGFMPQNTTTMANPAAGGPFDPLISRMYETGAKADFLNGNLGATVALYHLEQNNVLVNANSADNPDLLEQRGQERGRGVEVDVNGKILENLFISANYTYSKTIISRSNNKEIEGQLKENAPLQQGGAWLKYSIGGGKLKGIGVAAGFNFVTERRTFSNILQLPAYNVVDAAVYYRYDKVQLSVNFNNILDKTYWEGGYDFNRLFPGAPRNFIATIAYTL